MIKLSRLLLIGFFSAFLSNVSAQCTTPVTTFPYNENFEATNGGWTTGGTASDWTWGTPAKSVITGAAAGSKCWIVGGLTGNSYNNGEDAWLQSPCFNFSALINPEIRFSVFWETEKKFDGASIQYSTNDGVNWINLGSATDGPCLGTNWFNNTAVTYLGNTAGWSGNIQSTSGSCQGGSGSGVWLQARHSLSFLVSFPKVIFRFRFGAGTTCNNFNGFAIDEFSIAETPANTTSFTYTCGPNNSINFVSQATGCPLTYTWDFDDAASGSNNISYLANPVHVFSTPGNFVVSLTVTYTQGSPIVFSDPVNVINVSTAVTNPLKCNADANGAVTANVSGPPGAYNFIWNTSPPQTTAAINNLKAGSYTVAVSGNNACLTSAIIDLVEPPAIVATASTTDAFCGNNNGKASVIISGGVTPYNYLWSNNTTGTSLSNTAPGNYSLLITDGNGCKLNKNNILIGNTNKVVNVSLGNDTVVCPGQSFVLRPGAFATYLWQDNSSNPTFTITGSGTYSVTVKDNDGCTGSASVKVVSDCSDIYFPTAFTPDRNGLNDYFGPFGNTGAIKNYSLRIYNRYGQLIFYSSNPLSRWDGRIKNVYFNSGSFVWVAAYSFNGAAIKTRSGMVTLLK